MNCGQCVQNWQRSMEQAREGRKVKIISPQCWSRGCRNSAAQIEGIEEWVVMFLRLRNSEVLKSTGMGGRMLEWADAYDEETLETFCRMESIYNRLLSEQREIEKLQR